MAYQIAISDVAERQLRAFTAHEQRIIEHAISTKLADQPTTVTTAVKSLRPNSFAQYELRVRSFRVLYNVEDQTVLILLVGRKAGNTLMVEGKPFHGHQDNPSP